MSRKSKAAEFLDVGYNIDVTGRNVQVTDSMKDYAMDKIAKIERFSHRVIDVHVTMDIQKIEHRVDIIARVDNTKIRCSASSENMYASIDKATDKLKEQFRRYKTRIQDHKSIGHEDAAMIVSVYEASNEVTDVNDEIDEENRRTQIDSFMTHQIVKQETRPLRTLNASEAIVKMELSGDAFMIFRSEEDLKLKVIYRREDGHFGVIAPE